ncbi:ankyrin repeat domain-containing protein [Legionella drancourtii]|uniref:Ankyrin repeat-containing protein n=1 Tax=Legionella drancourtii LLAP12 TaxID=658187 RepID=G9EK83_9GAMM|nr:ankyrin repeat domain-containing protein [Legionella drancourtii]EHL32234.1 ankyrin repeat-containing protein [Legionella drancourtii LLAP12]
MSLEKFKSIFNKANAYEKDKNDLTLLHYSLNNPDINVAKWLAETFPDLVNATSKNVNTILHNAIRGDKTKISQWFAQKFPCLLNIKNKNHFTPFGLAARYNRHKIAEWLIKHFPACIQDEPIMLQGRLVRERAPFYIAFVNDNFKIMELLYRYNNDCIHEYYYKFFSFFLSAVSSGSLKSVEWFLTKATLERYYENEPIRLCILLDCALYSDKEGIIELLLSKIPHPINQPINGQPLHLLHYAIRLDYLDVVKWLLSTKPIDTFPAGNISYFDLAMYAPATLQYFLSTYPELALQAYKDDPTFLSKYIRQCIEEREAEKSSVENCIACIVLLLNGQLKQPDSNGTYLRLFIWHCLHISLL